MEGRNGDKNIYLEKRRYRERGEGKFKRPTRGVTFLWELGSWEDTGRRFMVRASKGLVRRLWGIDPKADDWASHDGIMDYWWYSRVILYCFFTFVAEWNHVRAMIRCQWESHTLYGLASSTVIRNLARPMIGHRWRHYALNLIASLLQFSKWTFCRREWMRNELTNYDPVFISVSESSILHHEK